MQFTNFVTLALILVRRAIYRFLYVLDTTVLKRKNQLFILSYHSVASDNWRFSISKTQLMKQIDQLRKQYDIITLAMLDQYMQGKITLKRPSVILSFDDGYKDILILKPYFKKHDIRPALFVLSNTKEPNWKELATKRPFLNKSELLSLQKLGWEIGSHSATHTNLATLSEKELLTEVKESKKFLEKILGKPVTHFAYPRGQYTSTVLSAVKKAKYKYGFTMDDGEIKPGINAFAIPRIGVDGTHSLNEFETLASPSVVQFRKLIKESPLGRYL